MHGQLLHCPFDEQRLRTARKTKQRPTDRNPVEARCGAEGVCCPAAAVTE